MREAIRPHQRGNQGVEPDEGGHHSERALVMGAAGGRAGKGQGVLGV